MPRSGQLKPVSDRRLSDLVSVGLLTRVFPADLVDEVIAGTGRTEQRHRALPARVMAYFSIAMALYSDGSYEDVMAQVTDGLSWSSDWAQSYVVPSKSGIFQARVRLGPEPVEALFRRVAKPLAEPEAPGGWWVWPSAAPMPSSMPRSDLIRPPKSPWRVHLWIASGRECWCSSTAD